MLFMEGSTVFLKFTALYRYLITLNTLGENADINQAATLYWAEHEIPCFPSEICISSFWK